MTQLCIDKGVSEFGCNLISWGLVLSYIIFGIAVVAIIGMSLLNSMKNPGSLVKSGIGIGILLVVFIIAYMISDGTRSAIAIGLDQSESSVRWIGAGLIMFYLALLAAIVGLVYSELCKAFK